MKCQNSCPNNMPRARVPSIKLIEATEDAAAAAASAAAEAPAKRKRKRKKKKSSGATITVADDQDDVPISSILSGAVIGEKGKGGDDSKPPAKKYKKYKKKDKGNKDKGNKEKDKEKDKNKDKGSRNSSAASAEADRDTNKKTLNGSSSSSSSSSSSTTTASSSSAHTNPVGTSSGLKNLAARNNSNMNHQGSNMMQQQAYSAPSLQVLRMKTPGVPRMDNTSVARPIVYGSMAFWLGKQANEFHSHRWTIYVRGLQCEDLSYMISKVIFSLHPDFAEPERTCC
jgi:hypothetical protein